MVHVYFTLLMGLRLSFLQQGVILIHSDLYEHCRMYRLFEDGLIIIRSPRRAQDTSLPGNTKVLKADSGEGGSWEGKQAPSHQLGVWGVL